jgi:catechol 2,3-dioxygenase-like lactoylglutathione lyase family enzyme
MAGRVSAVLFVKDLAKVTDFYEAVLGVSRVYSDEYHKVLRCGTFALDIHQIPTRYAQDIHIDTPPQRREQAALKLSFPVDSIARARQAAAEHGGLLDPGPPVWVIEQQKICMGHDPEGNVFQLQEDD